MINVLILVPEITKGMKSIGSKSLLEIKKNLSVLDYQIQYIKTIDKNINITVCTGFESEKIASAIISRYKKNVDYIYNPLYKTTNQAHSIALYLKEHRDIDNLLILSNGILLKNNSITKRMLNKDSKIFVLNKEKENFNLGCCKQDKLEYIFYDLPELWSECVYLNKETLTIWSNILSDKNTNQMYLFEIINKTLERNIPFEKEYIDKKLIMKISTIKDISKAKSFI